MNGFVTPITVEAEPNETGHFVLRNCRGEYIGGIWNEKDAHLVADALNSAQAMREALKAAKGAFDTPLVTLKLGGKLNDYQADAIARMRLALSSPASGDGREGEATALLRDLEWAGGDLGDFLCPSCGGKDPDMVNGEYMERAAGHRPDCRLAKLIGGK